MSFCILDPHYFKVFSYCDFVIHHVHRVQGLHRQSRSETDKSDIWTGLFIDERVIVNSLLLENNANLHQWRNF